MALTGAWQGWNYFHHMKQPSSKMHPHWHLNQQRIEQCPQPWCMYKSLLNTSRSFWLIAACRNSTMGPSFTSVLMYPRCQTWFLIYQLNCTLKIYWGRLLCIFSALLFLPLLWCVKKACFKLLNPALAWLLAKGSTLESGLIPCNQHRRGRQWYYVWHVYEL